MSKEMIFSGYCRVLDQSRMVMTEWEDRDLLERGLLLRRMCSPKHL